MANNPMETWATKASRHTPKRCLQENKRRMDNKPDVHLVGSVLFEDDDLKCQILASKAMAILQQSLSSGSVLFSFQKTLFNDRADAYDLIKEQISSKVEFRTISLYDAKRDGSLIIEARFTDPENAKKAMVEGVTVQGVVYKASSNRETTEFGEVKHVQFTLLRMVDKSTFLHDLMQSLSYFGRVLQVKQFTRRGYFEGQLSVIIDTSVGYQVDQQEWQEAKPLDRMLYLSEFDCYVTATYKGAPPVCHFCQHSGHIRAKCPELAKRRCFGCNKHGHMLRFCPEGKQAEYLKKQKVSHDSEEVVQARAATEQVSDFVDSSKIGEGEAKQVEEEEVVVEYVVDSVDEEHLEDASVDIVHHSTKVDSKDSEDMEDDLQEKDEQVKQVEDEDMEEDHIVLAGAGSATSKGSLFSKYAPMSVALSMSVDKPEEMLCLTKVKASTQRKLDALKQGSSSGVKTGGVGGAGFKTGGVAGVGGAGVKANKSGGKTPTGVKNSARRAQ